MIIKEAISPVAMGKFPVDSVLGKSENHPLQIDSRQVWIELWHKRKTSIF